MQDITIQQFSSLSSDLQCKMLYRHGVYIGKQKIDKKMFVLYQLHAFYVEIVYNKYRDIIQHMNYSKSVKIADPYLVQVYVEELVNFEEYFF